MERPSIPTKLKRLVLVEAGHRCAIPTCRHPTVDIAHITPWSEVKEHKYENLIALCPNCHRRADRGEIDRKSLRIYKRILQRLTDRYFRFEVVFLTELSHKEPIDFPENMLLLIKNLLDDGLVEAKAGRSWVEGIPPTTNIFLTKKGHMFIEDWIKANEDLTY